jgi:hypothetical protein
MAKLPSLSTLSSGNWILRWGATLSDDPQENHDRVLAYESMATQEGNGGCWMLPLDGSLMMVIAGPLDEWIEAQPIGHEIGAMYLAYCKINNKAPSELKDLEPFAKEYPQGYQAIRDRKWVVLGTQKSAWTQRRARTGYWPMG